MQCDRSPCATETVHNSGLIALSGCRSIAGHGLPLHEMNEPRFVADTMEVKKTPCIIVDYATLPNIEKSLSSTVVVGAGVLWHPVRVTAPHPSFQDHADISVTHVFPEGFVSDVLQHCSQ